MLAQEFQIAAGVDVVLHRHHEERRGIGGGIKIGRGFPVDKIRGLRELVHHFAVGALAADEELERQTAEREVSVAVDRVKRPQGIASEEPAKTGTRGVAGGIISGNESGLLVELHARLIDGDRGPSQGIVEPGVGSFGRQAIVEEMRPIALGARIEVRNAIIQRRQLLRSAGRQQQQGKNKSESLFGSNDSFSSSGYVLGRS